MTGVRQCTPHDPPRREGLAGALRDAAQSLSPAYFALVMATGIVSLALRSVDLPRAAQALFWLNVAAYLTLWCLTALRAMWFPRELWRDLLDHARGPGSFASVAASAVLGSQFVLLGGDFAIATLLWILAAALWLGLTYALFAALTIKERKPRLEQSISGTWLLAVVATQSIAVLSAYLAPQAQPAHRLELDFVALAMWLSGGMLYVWIAGLIFYRLVFFTFSPRDLSPAYWINMGATAISTLAGSLLIANAAEARFLASLEPFLEGFTLVCWAVGTWWIPLLVVLVVWRHAFAGFPWKYDPIYWSAVFPLGMYAAGTFEMAHALRLDDLYAISRGFAYLALGAWVLAFAGLVRTVAGEIVVRWRSASARA